jgi:hypothetical protein
LLADAIQFFTLKGLLRSFTESTGLRVNYSKSFFVSINVDEGKALHQAQTIGCQVAAMPFIYLGLPFGTTRPSVEEFFPLVNKIGRRMMSMIKMLSYQDRLILINSVLSTFSTFYMCALKILISILE